MKIYANKRKAISPIIATVLIIAVTLIAAVAIGGFVFGLFGSSSSTAQVTSVNAALIHLPVGAGLAVTCASSAGATPGGFVQLQNTGTVNTVITAVSLTYGGSTYSATLTSCLGSQLGTVTAGSSLFLQFTANAALASTSGQQFNGFVVTSNGAQVVFAGTFT
jgi:flagellin-like protein